MAGITFAITLDFNIRWVLKINWFIILLSISLVYFIISLFDDNKKNLFAYFALIGIAISGFTIFTLTKGSLIHYAWNVRDWFLLYQSNEESYQIGYSFTIVFLVIVLLSLIFYLIYKKRFVYYISILGLFCWLIYGSVVRIPFNKVTVGLLLIVIMQVIVEVCNNLYNKNNQGNYNLTNFYLLPVCIIIGLVAVSLPSKQHPIQWTTVKRFVSTAVDKWDDITFRFGILTGEYSEEFNVSFTGYLDEENKNLGGQIQSSKQSILDIISSENTYGSTYLIGSVRDEYTSKGWKRSDIHYNTEREPEVDFYQLLYGLYQNNVTPSDREFLFHRMNIDVNYTNIRTKNIFYPLKTYQIEMYKNPVDYEYSTPTILTKKLLKKGFSYQLKYYEVNYQSDTMQNYLREISKVDQSGTENLSKPFSRIECINYIKQMIQLAYIDESIINDKFATLIQNREDTIKQYYTKLPNKVPERVYKLAEQITEKYDNNYDKLRAIERYLSEFQYTLTPTNTKKDADFVDDFLFNQKKGYCTYFASSMAVLARCVGIPTRYVEGILIGHNMKQGQENIVKGGSAHAWVEAYIDGVGWIPFEPTPGKYSDRYGLWPIKKSSQEVGKTQPFTPPTNQGYTPTTVDKNVREVLISKSDMKRIQYMMYTGIIIVVIIIVLLIFVMIGLNQNRKRKYKNASSFDKIKYFIHGILDYLKLEGYELEEGETLTDFVNRVGKNYDFDEYSLSEVIQLYTKIRYDKNTLMVIGEVEMNRIIQYHILLKDHMKGKLRWIQRVWFQLNMLFKTNI